MASSSPFLQNENVEKHCEKLIDEFCKEEDISGKIGLLASLTSKVLPNISLFEIEAVYLVKVVPKVCESVFESLDKITDYLRKLVSDREDESVINEIQSHLKGVIGCMESLESCAAHISQLTNSELSIKQYPSFHPGAFKIIMAAFNHCKDSESLYGSFFQHFAEDLSNLFKKTFQLQKALMELMDKVDLQHNADTEEVQSITQACHHLLQICVIIGDIDAGLLVNTWKVLHRLVTKHKAMIRNDLDVDKIICHLCESVKSKMSQCISMASVLEGQSPNDIKFANTIEAKSFTKMIKVVRFLIGLLMQIVKEYCSDLGDILAQVLNLLSSIYSSVPPSLSAPCMIPDTLPEISSSILVVIQPLLKVLISSKSFVKSATSKSTVTSYGLCRVLLDIAAILPAESDEIYTLWMDPTTFPEEEPRLSLLQAVTETLKTCKIELNLPIYVDGVMCAGKPMRKVSLYEHAVTHLSALIASCPASCFPFIEQCLVECLLCKEFFLVVLAMDLWTFMARWESADLCSQHVHFLIILMQNLPERSTTYTHVAILVRRLTCLMAKDHQERLFSSFPPSKAENLFLWSALPLKSFPENIQTKICRTAVPACIKQCNDSLSNDQVSHSYALGCLKSIYSIENVQRLVPAVHHAAIVDIIATLWTNFSQQSIKLHEKIWLQVIQLTGLLVTYIQPDLYAKILRCLANLLNQYSSIDMKVAIAQFLGKCGTKEVLPDFETGVFGSISGLFSSLVSDESWLVCQISLQSVKSFAEVTPYTHIMGDCVPERLLPSLSDFLSNIPYKQQELALNRTTWIQNLLKSQLLDDNRERKYQTFNSSPISEDPVTSASILEPERKRLKRDEQDNNKEISPYSNILETFKIQLDVLNELRVKQPPSHDFLKELSNINLMLMNYLDRDKVSGNNDN